MVTRKTRLLSAVAAVLMLVSMLTCFVLPAVAAVADYEMPEAPDGLVAYSERGDSTATDFAISSAKDWLAMAKAAEDDNATFEGITFWFTNDIDFSEEELDPADPTKYFLNNYGKEAYAFKGTIQGQGYAIKNMDVDLNWTATNGNRAYIGLICYAINATVRDLTIDSSCSFNYTTATYTDTAKTTEKEVQVGVFMGYGMGSTFINCHNKANVVFTNAGDPSKASSVSTFGRQQDGVKLINCSNSGDITNNDVARASGLAEWINVGKTSYIYNTYNTGKLTTAYDGSNDYTGLMSTSASSGSVDAIVTGNVYNVGDSVNSGTRNATAMEAKGTALAEGDDASGKLAYLLNANHAGNYGRIYYTVENGATAVGTAADRTIAIVLDDAGVATTVYVNLDEANGFDLADLHEIGAPIYEVAAEDVSYVSIEDSILTVTGAPADSAINISVYSDVVDLTELKAAYAELSALPVEEQGWYTSDAVSGTLAEFLVAVKAKIDATETATAGAYTSGKAVAEDLELLNTFSVAGIVPVAAFAKYKDAEGYTVANAKDLEYLSTVKDELTAKQTVYFTADIDLSAWTADTYTDVDGDVNNLLNLKASLDGGKAANGKAKISGLKIVTDGNSGWLGSFTGGSIKNLAFENCTSLYNNINYGSLLVMSVAASTDYDVATFENLSFKNCTSTSAPVDYEGAAGNRRCNLVVGSLYRATNFKDITIENCTLMSNTHKGNSAFLAGVAGVVVNAENIYLNNNTIAGMTGVVGQGLLLGEVSNVTSLKNVAVFNTSYKMSENPEVEGETTNRNDPAAGLVGAYVKEAAKLSIENLLMYNNGVADVVNSHSTKSATQFGTMKDIYTDAASFSDVEFDYTTDNATVAAPASDFTTGKAAHALNAADVEKQWAMDGATPVFASETAKAPVEITFKALDAKLKDAEAPVATYTLYTDKDGKLIGLTQEILDAASWDNEAGLADAVFNAEAAIIGYTTPAHDHQLSYTDNGDGTHTVACTFSHTDAELGTFTCDYAEAPVAHELEKKNISDILFTTPYDVHQVVDACKHCTYVADESTAVDCTGAITVDPEQSWDATCAHGGMRVSVCDACDYEFTRIDIPRPHAWGDWIHIEGTDTHKRTCANVADCHVADEVEDCVFENWTVTTLPEVGVAGEKTGTCECGNIKKEPVPALAGIELDSGMAVVGKELEVTVDLKSNTAKLAGVTLEITYDADVLTLKDAENGSWNATFATDFPAATGKTTTKLTMVSAANIEGDGTLLKLIFDVKNDEALANVATEIEVNVAEAKDENLQIVEFEGDKLTVDIRTSMMKGDIDGNQVVNMVDAILLLRYVSGTELPDGIENMIGVEIADLTAEGDGADLGDGQVAPEINLNDVIYLLRYLNGWIVEL